MYFNSIAKLGFIFLVIAYCHIRKCTIAMLLLKALVDLVMTINKAAALKSDRSSMTLSSLSRQVKSHSSVTSAHGGLSKEQKPFDAMNNIVAHLLLNMTRL